MNSLSALILTAGMLGGALIISDALPLRAAAQNVTGSEVMPVMGADALLTMPLLQDNGWFVHAYGGRIRACTADGASVAGERTAPKCSAWSEH